MKTPQTATDAKRQLSYARTILSRTEEKNRAQEQAYKDRIAELEAVLANLQEQ